MSAPKELLFVDDEPNFLKGYERRLRKEFCAATALGPLAGLEFLTFPQFENGLLLKTPGGVIVATTPHSVHTGHAHAGLPSERKQTRDFPRATSISEIEM